MLDANPAARKCYNPHCRNREDEMPFVGQLCLPCATSAVNGVHTACPECGDLMSMHVPRGAGTWFTCRLCGCATRAKAHTWLLVRLGAAS